MRLVLCVAVALVSLLGEAARADDDLIWGVNGHPLVSYPGVNFDDQLHRVQDLGMRSYRVDVNSKAQADKLAELIAKGRERNLTILPILNPQLDFDKAEADQLYREAYDFAQFYVSRFKRDIRVWELGNELENYAIIKPCEKRDDGTQYNCAWGLAGGASVLDYYGPRWKKVSSVLKGLSNATKAADPTARKAMGTAGWGHYGAFERMRQDGIEWDISVWHTFSSDIEGQLLRVAAYGKPIWITELNHPFGSRDGAVAQAIGIEKMMQEVRAVRQRFKVEAAYIYELLDETYWAPSYEGMMGLIYLAKGDDGAWREDGAKPAYCTVQGLLKGGWRMGEKAKPPAKAVWFPVPAPTRSCNLCEIDSRDGTLASLVQYASCLTLGRTLDAGGVKQWVGKLQNSEMTAADMLEKLVMTRVAQVESARGGTLANRAFVAFLYRLLLDHDPDGHGLGAYTSEIDDGRRTRQEVARALIDHGVFKWRHSGLFKSIN